MTKEAALSGFAKWRRDIADSIYEEISAMMSGHFIPYHKLCFMAAFLTALIFSILFTQMGVIEAPVAVPLDGWTRRPIPQSAWPLSF